MELTHRWIIAIPGLIHAMAALAVAQPTVVFETNSIYNTIVVTEDQDGLRTLSFERGGARQSVVRVGDPDHVELPYARAMLVSLAMVREPDRILVVGLGGGTLPSFLHRHYPEARIDTVDIDPGVVQVAKDYFGFKEDDRLRAHVQDGRSFIEQCDERYDLILLDAFSSDSIPRQLTTREFLQAVRRALTPRGMAVANLWSRGSNSLYDSMVRTYEDVFDRLYLLDVPGAGNIILFALPGEAQFTRKQLERQTKQLTAEWRVTFELDTMVRRGFGPIGPRSPDGRILIDEREPVMAE
jgi:spermidine synthase